jgi:MFS family permease
MSRLSESYAALRSRNFRLWWGGQLISLFGTWMQSTAQGYLIYDLTRSPAQLGLVAFFAGVPSWIFMLYAGVVADRLPQRRVLIGAQITMMLSALILSTLVFTGLVQPWHIWCLAFLTGIGNAFDAPSRQAFVPKLVPREDLTNAVAMNSTMFNTASVVGPALGGLVYAAWGPGWCFLLNAFSFLAIIGALASMRGLKHVTKDSHPAWEELLEGFRYIAGEPLVKTLILFIAMMSLVGLSYATMFPAWAVSVLHGDARVVGYLQSSRGLGALGGALFVAALGRIRCRGALLMGGAAVFPLTLWLFSTTTSVPEAVVALLLAGASSMVAMNLAMAMMQTTIKDSLRGRVMAVYTLSFFGMMPLGGLLVGYLAECFGERRAIVFLALTFALATGSLLFRNRAPLMSEDAS